MLRFPNVDRRDLMEAVGRAKTRCIYALAELEDVMHKVAMTKKKGCDVVAKAIAGRWRPDSMQTIAERSATDRRSG